MHIVRAILVFAFLGSLLAPAALGQADDRPERIIVYLNADNPRVVRALSILEAAFAKAGVSRRHRTRLIHIKADVSNAAEIDMALHQALTLNPDVIIAPNSNAAAAAKALTRTVPIVFGSHQDPISMRLVDSLARPGANLTGFTYYVPVDQKRLELLRQIAPRARKLGIVIDRWWLDEQGGREVVAHAREKSGFEPELFATEDIGQLKQALATPRAREMDAWYVPYTALPFWEPAEVLDVLQSMNRPVAFPATLFVERGGLFSYQPTLTLEESALLWATMVGLILDGVSPGEIPVERPKAFELAINVDTARRLGLHLDASLLKRADRVVFGEAKALAEAR
jgi:putative ABC transport system substrate-binding protein